MLEQTVDMHSLLALSPLDGRYRPEVAALADYFSESALMRYRVRVEVEYLIFLGRSPRIPQWEPIPAQTAGALRNLYRVFMPEYAQAIAEWDRRVNHDVKAVEYWLREQLERFGLEDRREAVHFGLTSEDVNNLAYALMVQEARNQVLLPALADVLTILRQFQLEEAETPMLARTHGQPATPTTLGKEFAVFAGRLNRGMDRLVKAQLTGKLNGASGDYAAHTIAIPDVDWITFSKGFISFLGLEPILLTTQIEPHDTLIELLDALRRINTLLIDLCQDIWRYISDGYLVQRTVAREVGSSTMPHKVNPIDFENAEGNLLLANALLEFFGRKLPISRLQRDLSDSTVLRNLGVAFGHSLYAYRRLIKGLNKIAPDRDRMLRDLRANPQVLAEAIQTVLRAEGYPEPYEAVKAISRGREITIEDLREFVRGLPMREEAKERLLALTPEGYIGLAAKLARLRE
ncbi:MAG: adenylosuccinate lyase [Herpetosiphonaceae bacterium]|nr:MAG: adenylosuccinate lyase [Herpetosiphonaceae bacterium]